MLSRLILYLLGALRVDCIADSWASMLARLRVRRLRARGIPLSFVPQGGYDFCIAGDLSRFHIDSTSHIKSGTFIECSGGVSIGRYFHTGRGLTIFSSAHDYKGAQKIPYDEKIILKSVLIGDFVWCGVNVTILPGVKIGEGAIVAANSVVTKDVPDLAVVAGNPARIISRRDADHFYQLKDDSKYY
nr:acyltransferase [Chromobacterium vaccinii]